MVRCLLMMPIMRHRHQCVLHLTFMTETQLRNEKWVVLGDMLELGEDEQMYHESLADQMITMDLRRNTTLRTAYEMAIR